MNDQKPDDVVDAPAAEAPAKAKRGRPKKEAGIKVPGKKRRDIYHEAFGDKRAGIAVQALKRGPDGKAIIAAVKLFSSSASKRAKLETQRARLMEKNAEVVKRVEALDADLAKFDGATEAMKGYRGRVLSMIDTIYGKPEVKPTVSL